MVTDRQPPPQFIAAAQAAGTQVVVARDTRDSS